MAKKPTFVQLDPTALATEARAADAAVYAASDADAYSRLGSLYPTRDAEVQRAYQDLSSQDPTLNAAFEQTGLGDINLGKNNFEISRNLRQDPLAGEQRARNYWSSKWQENKPRAFGPSRSDIVSEYAANTGNQANFANAINQIDASNAQIEQSQNAALIGTLVNGLAPAAGKAVTSVFTPPTNAAAAYYAPSNYLDPNVYKTPYAPVSGVNFAPSNYGGTYEGTLNNLPVYRAEPVSSTYTSAANTSSSW